VKSTRKHVSEGFKRVWNGEQRGHIWTKFIGCGKESAIDSSNKRQKHGGRLSQIKGLNYLLPPIVYPSMPKIVLLLFAFSSALPLQLTRFRLTRSSQPSAAQKDCVTLSYDMPQSSATDLSTSKPIWIPFSSTPSTIAKHLCGLRKSWSS
jgi:hypothetical protein